MSGEGFPVAVVVKNLPVSAGDIRGAGSIPRSGRSSGVGNDNPFQYSFLEKPMDRGAWWVGYSSWGLKEPITTESIYTHVYI